MIPLVCSVGLLWSVSGAAQDETQTTNGASAETVVPADHLVTWLTSLTQARQLSSVRRAPVVVVAGATWCGPCRQLEQEIESDVMQDELQRWIAAHIDVDQQPDAATELAVSSIPAIRVLSPDGRLIAAREGAISGSELSSWLNDQFETATRQTVAEWPSSDQLSATDVLSVLKDFRSREATVRETAVSRLAAVPKVAAAPVIAGFAEGGLAERLALLELLVAWDAPVGDLDPWIPTSVTADRIETLEQWMADSSFDVQRDPEDLSASELLEARRLVRHLSTAEATEAAALREQLARMGRRVLPLIRDALETEQDSDSRRRLTIARYRVAATPELEQQWPGGTERLASADFDERIDAAGELVALATAREEPLLLELFSSPVPLVREIALQGLSEISGTSASSALVRLLDDPDPNVRAAVLKELAEAPSEKLIARIADYVRNETDPDLVVHAIRFLREIKQPAAVNAMTPLFKHPSWRVRAEAADGVCRLIRKSGMRECRNDTNLGTAFLTLLQDEDEFVVGVAIGGLPYVNAPTAADDLVDVADNRPAVAATAVTTLGSSFISHNDVTGHLIRFSGSDQPAVRSAATIALLRHSEEQHVDTVIRSLTDQDPAVRMAVADAVFTQFRRGLISQLQDVSYAPEFQAALTESVQAAAPESPLSVATDLLFTPAESDADDDIAETPLGIVDASRAAVGEQAAVQRGEDIDREITRLRTDRDLPAWIYQVEPVLKQMLAQESREERLSAARTLAMLGDLQAMEAVHEAARHRTFLPQVAAVFPGLSWSEKQTLFDLLRNAAETHDERYLLANALAMTHDTRSPPKIWELLAASSADARLAGELPRPLTQACFSRHHYDVSTAEDHERARLKHQTMQKISSGTRWQQVAGLTLLSEIDPILTRKAAESLLADTSQSAAVRADGLRVLLSSLPPADAAARATASLTEQKQPLAAVALHYLALGRHGIQRLSNVVAFQQPDIPDSATMPDVLTVPEGVNVPQLQPFTRSKNARDRACAAGLLALLGQPVDLSPVIDYWRTASDDPAVRRLTWQAIAAADDDSSVSVLRRMYRDLKSARQQTEIVTLQKALARMTGPDAEKLRNVIRTDRNRGRPVDSSVVP
ncbi:MAG: HEAT repeat domain-containing protein [Fuerstiella sp.]